MMDLRTLLLLTSLAPFLALADPVSPEEVIDLIDGELGPSFVQHLNEKASPSTQFGELWQKTDDGELLVRGNAMGYLRTVEAYENYHLVLEYRWGERTFAGRADKARDGGLLFHITGDDGAFGGTWPACVQVNLLEGGSGDLVALPTETTKAGFRANATVQDPPLWAPTGQMQDFPFPGERVAHLGWKDRSENWKDVRGFRGELDLENPVGEWNRLEVICDGDKVDVILNGDLVTSASGVFPAGGTIGLQTELAEYSVRRMELFPLGKFSESWVRDAASTDMGYSVTGESILPRRLPYSPEKSAALWEIDGDFTIELVAAEPLVSDPVDVVWDENGRMFVAEMGDYPLPTDHGAFLSRIRVLDDDDGDGVMDRASTWAGDLDHVQGLLPMRGGILATTRTAIVFLKDTDGDDIADVRETLFRSNMPRYNQLQISSPRWGLDNRIYFSNGLDGDEIYPEGSPEATLEFSGLNLRYDPRSGMIEPATGLGQYGGTFDSFGRHFYCSNRNPGIVSVLPLEVVDRNPLSGIVRGHEDIQESGGKVYPVALSHTTSAAHAGTHTAACGVAVYTGNLTPELTGDYFVCDPTAQLVTRNRLLARGPSFTAERVGKGQDFLASGDEWVRPVQVRNGPDGGLYIVDMYRRFIDHARFFPDDFADSNFLRAGFDQGRIYRVRSAGDRDPTVALPAEAPALVSLLGSENGWQQTHAQRLLVQNEMIEAIPLLEKRLAAGAGSPESIARALWTLHGLGALRADHLAAPIRSENPGLVENALLLARELEIVPELIRNLVHHDSKRVQLLAVALFPSAGFSDEELAGLFLEGGDRAWMRKAILSYPDNTATRILNRLLDDPDFLLSSDDGSDEIIAEFSRMTTAQTSRGDFEALLDRLTPTASWSTFAILSGVINGIRQSRFPFRSLEALLGEDLLKPETNATIESLLLSASEIAVDASESESTRHAALLLVDEKPWTEKSTVTAQLLTPKTPHGLQSAACRLLSRGKPEEIANFFLTRWDSLPPTSRREALSILVSNTESGLALMEAMQRGEVSPSIMPQMTRWSYGRSENEAVKSLAVELFGHTDTDRSAVIKEYAAAIADLPGDPENGAHVFTKSACASCHQIGDLGVVVGPKLNDLKNKPREALLTDILDPNRAVEERWIPLTVTTNDGRILSGLVEGDPEESIGLRLPGGHKEMVTRSEITKFESNEVSMMPVGLEAMITPPEMADLISFLQKR